MNTPMSDVMQNKLDAIPFGGAVYHTFNCDSHFGKEEAIHSTITSKEKLLIEHYELFPGIEVSYNYFLADHFSHQHPQMPTIMEISHCRDGRMGWQMENNMNLYLGKGDVSFHMKEYCSTSALSLPLGYYEGISFSIGFQTLQKNSPDILKTANLDYAKLQSEFCDTTKITVLSRSNEIDSIFQVLYNLPKHLVIPYCKLKSQEFVLFLSKLSAHDLSNLHMCDTAQVKIVKEIHGFLTSNIEERYTIDYLSKKYLMNTSTLKATFKAVYGAPIAAYMKQYRMNQAITYLKETDYNMAEIATAVGYENQSKFTAAFKSVVGVLPTTYRKTYK